MGGRKERNEGCSEEGRRVSEGREGGKEAGREGSREGRKQGGRK